MVGVTSGVTFFLFRFCHDSADCLLNFLIGQWFIVVIIVIDWYFQHICIVFVPFCSHVHSFIKHIKSVQKIFTTFEYVKISRHIICNLIIYAFLLVNNALWFVFLHRTFVDDDAFRFIYVVLHRKIFENDAF